MGNEGKKGSFSSRPSPVILDNGLKLRIKIADDERRSTIFPHHSFLVTGSY